VVVGIAGIGLIALAVRLALRGRRRRTKLLAIPACLVVAQWVVLPIVVAGFAVNAPRPQLPTADTVDHLRVLARAGYAGLAYDARGHGRSDGQTNALGWRGADDLAGAVAFVRAQPGIDPRRIAALESEPQPLEAAAHAIRVPVLLVASRRRGERTIDEAYRARIGERAQLWYVAD
jgi:hypothetical protein